LKFSENFGCKGSILEELIKLLKINIYVFHNYYFDFH
jgi:hypothetical protein